MSNVLKQTIGYTFQDEDARKIDTNALIAQKLEMMAAKMQQRAEEEESFGDDFSLGLDAMAVDALLADPEEDGSGEGNVIKADGEAQAMNSQMAAQYIAGAQAEAEEILEDARAQAEAILEDARAQAREVLQDAASEGQKTGYNEGYQAGLKEVDQKKQELVREKALLQEEYEKLIDELEPRFVEVLTGVYEHIFHVNLSGNKEVIFYLIQDAVRKVESSKNFIIHVSKEDYGFVSMQKKELLEGVAGADSAEIVEDMTLKPNECYIETGSGIFDCGLETQLKGLKRELRLLSYVHEGA